MMPQFSSGRHTSIDEALRTVINNAGSDVPTRRHFHVTDFDGYSDTEVLITPVKGGVKVVLPNYAQTRTNGARTTVEDPSEESVKNASLNLITEHVRGRISTNS